MIVIRILKDNRPLIGDDQNDHHER